jgi:acetolactate synthase-1/2/3 large subunit
LIAGRPARTPEGLARLVELAELLQAPVQDMRFPMRMNFPNRHPLKLPLGTPVGDADLIVGLEHPEFYVHLVGSTPVNRLGMAERRLYQPGAKIATINASELITKSNYQEFGRYVEADLAIAADTEATLPSLIEACRKVITPDRKRAFEQRGARLATASREAWHQGLDQASWGWDASPISTARLSAEIWNQIKDEDWALVSDVSFINSWPHRMWDFTRHYQYIGWSGAYGIGYGIGGAVGAALAHRAHGRLAVNIQCDGDLNYAPAVLWTAAHHRIPLLTVMHNNRAYHQERMYITDVAAKVKRDVRRAGIGNDLTDPNIDYASLAKAYGVHGIGPVENPNDLGPALKRAIDVVRRGEPALVDVLTQAR